MVPWSLGFPGVVPGPLGFLGWSLVPWGALGGPMVPWGPLGGPMVPWGPLGGPMGPKGNSVIKQHLVHRKNDLRPPQKSFFRALFDFSVKSRIQATQNTFISKIHFLIFFEIFILMKY